MKVELTEDDLNIIGVSLFSRIIECHRYITRDDKNKEYWEEELRKTVELNRNFPRLD